MDISRAEQRILHIMAQGGRIDIEKDERGQILELNCVTRDGWCFPGLDMPLFRKIKRKRAIQSRNGGPYRITRRGLQLVRSQGDNR
ncbi:YjhX family toxin [uncultured Nitratireductor sp.]|uniref:YjhX family toxin n=1 Tax=uncultured Nitratireductor sp. TaxID=520953 RepID=UPI0025CBE8E9|nr:YjhX family toxin [uncultured Nitratireductor sp.]